MGKQGSKISAEAEVIVRAFVLECQKRHQEVAEQYTGNPDALNVAQLHFESGRQQAAYDLAVALGLDMRVPCY